MVLGVRLFFSYVVVYLDRHRRLDFVPAVRVPVASSLIGLPGTLLSLQVGLQGDWLKGPGKTHISISACQHFQKLQD